MVSLEPEAQSVLKSSEFPLEKTPHFLIDTVSTLSIAISLKRIADVLEGTPERIGVVEHYLNGLANLKNS